MEFDPALRGERTVITPAPAGKREAWRRSPKTIAKDSGLGRESLYKALSAGAHPRFETINSVLRALGVKIAVVAERGVRESYERQFRELKSQRRDAGHTPPCLLPTYYGCPRITRNVAVHGVSTKPWATSLAST
ncbi:MAG: DNA-binding protein [Terriglobales bacterium]